jgi:flagellar biosynthesis/type III secretory pathway protein FliH
VAAGVQAQPKPLSQQQYHETPYEDQAWEIVGTLSEKTEFLPLEISVLPRAKLATDPMFQDFGGLSAEKQAKRFHIPSGLGKDFGSQKHEDPDAGKVKLFPQELEALKRSVFEEGFRAGMTKGQEEGNAKLQSLQKGMQTVLQDLAQQITQNLRGLERSSVELSLAIAEKIVGYAIEINPEYIAQLTREALSHAGSAVIKKVRVSPQDMEFIEVVGIPKTLLEMDGSWSFEQDESIKAGCVVETSAGEIDFRIEQAWDRLKDSVLKAVR